MLKQITQFAMKSKYITTVINKLAMKKINDTTVKIEPTKIQPVFRGDNVHETIDQLLRNFLTETYKVTKLVSLENNNIQKQFSSDSVSFVIVSERWYQRLVYVQNIEGICII